MQKGHMKISVDFPSITITAVVSLSVRFILLLFIYWKFHVADGRNRSGNFSGVKCMPTSFPVFLLLPILILPLTPSPSQPQQIHTKVQQDLQYITERNWRVKKNS